MFLVLVPNNMPKSGSKLKKNLCSATQFGTRSEIFLPLPDVWELFIENFLYFYLFPLCVWEFPPAPSHIGAKLITDFIYTGTRNLLFMNLLSTRVACVCRNFPRSFTPLAECLVSLAAASPGSCEQAVAAFTTLDTYTERLEDVEAGAAEVGNRFLVNISVVDSDPYTDPDSHR